MNQKKILLCSLILIFISGCSGTYKTYYQTLKIAFSEQKNFEMTLIEVQQSDVDVLSIKRGEGPATIMALAYLKNGQHKWISIDNVMLILEKGRIVRTLGLSKDLLYVSNTNLDPLKSLPYSATTKNILQQLKWSYITDLAGDEYGYPVESVFGPDQLSSVQTLNLNIDAVLHIESVSFKAPTNYFRLNHNWENQFWYAKTGELIKSKQRVSPLTESIEITYLSRIARLSQ
jgi:hypothetical protein